MPMETRGIVASFHKGVRSSTSRARRSRCTRPRTSSPATCRSPRAHVHVTARDVGGGFGQKMFVYREECAVVLASFLLGRPVKWIEDRRENLLSAGHSRNEFAHVKVAVDDDGIIQAITADHVCDVGAYAVCPAGMDPMLLPGPYKTPRLGFSIEMVWTNTMGKAAYRGPWMFETTAREMAHRPRRGRDRHRSRRAAAPQPPRLRRPALHRAERQRVPGDHAAGDARAGARAPRLRGVPQGTGRGAGRGPAPRRGHLLVRGADVDGQQHARHRGGAR